MCVTNVYVDVYPDGRSRTFNQVSLCQYGIPTNRPCSKASIIENPIRKIQWDEPTTEFILSQHRVFPTQPLTPPRSSAGSTHRLSGGYVSSTSDEGLRRRDSKRRSGSSRHSASSRAEQPKREHRKERIIIVEAPPTQAPRTPPRAFKQTFTAPNSPISRGRPIIVDERPRPRVPSVGAVVGDRPRRSTSSNRPRYGWDSPSSSHTSFDLQSAAEERAKAEAKQQRDERIAELEADRRRAERIRAHDEAIKRRPAVPLAPAPLRNRAFLSPVVDQTKDVQGMMGNLRLDERVVGDRPLSSESRRRKEERDMAAKMRQEAEEAEAMKSRLRERQMPGRRFSVGPAQRRERVLYSDGVYRYE